jgi:hypothetical protein
MEKYPVRVSYQWKKPEAKTHHGYAMGVVEAEGKTNEDVIKALKAKFPTLQPFDIIIVKLEWR